MFTDYILVLQEEIKDSKKLLIEELTKYKYLVDREKLIEMFSDFIMYSAQLDYLNDIEYELNEEVENQIKEAIEDFKVEHDIED